MVLVSYTAIVWQQDAEQASISGTYAAAEIWIHWIGFLSFHEWPDDSLAVLGGNEFRRVFRLTSGFFFLGAHLPIPYESPNLEYICGHHHRWKYSVCIIIVNFGFLLSVPFTVSISGLSTTKEHNKLCITLQNISLVVYYSICRV